jgi:hypothetical protein
LMDHDIRGPRRAAGPVDDVPASDEDVVHHRLGNVGHPIIRFAGRGRTRDQCNLV